MCAGGPRFRGGPVYSQAVITLRKQIKTYEKFILNVNSHIVDFGDTQMNLTFQRVSNCTTGGWFDICKFCYRNPACVLNAQLGDAFVENKPRFTGVKIIIDGKTFGFTTAPGEAIQELAHQIKAESKKLGYNETFIIGYANNHMGYFTTPREYEIGGYEGLLSFWGINTGENVKKNALKALEMVNNEK